MKRRFTMGKKGPDANHMGLQLLQKQKIFHDCFVALTGRADHESGTNLKADFFQIPKADFAVLRREDRRMENLVMRRIGGFVTQ